jgi:cysteine synthase A
VAVYLKDESIHPSGSLKHRLARSLFLHALCNGDLREGMTVVEASSGSTAISEAFFARLLGLPFVAVIPAGTAAGKRRAIEAMGGDVRLAKSGADPCDIAAELARKHGGLFMDQFTNAERATDWRGNNNIARSLFDQLGLECSPVPAWVVVGAGTGGTSATIGRYIRYRPELAATRLCVVDPPGSAFFPAFSGLPASAARCSGIVEGIGRPRVEASFMASVVDRMIEIPDAASIAATRWLAHRTGRRYGPSTGTNLVGVFTLAREMRGRSGAGSIVTLACDGGERYADTVYDDAWLAASGLDTAPWEAAFAGFIRDDIDSAFSQLRSAEGVSQPQANLPGVQP